MQHKTAAHTFTLFLSTRGDAADAGTADAGNMLLGSGIETLYPCSLLGTLGRVRPPVQSPVRAALPPAAGVSPSSVSESWLQTWLLRSIRDNGCCCSAQILINLDVREETR